MRQHVTLNVLRLPAWIQHANFVLKTRPRLMLETEFTFEQPGICESFSEAIFQPTVRIQIAMHLASQRCLIIPDADVSAFAQATPEV